jgi:putative transposase
VVVKGTLESRTKAVLLLDEGIKTVKEVSNQNGICEKTVRRWFKKYRLGGLEVLKPIKPGPRKAKHAISDALKDRIIRLKQKHPSWGARRIKHQYDLPVHWRTVHDAIKQNGLLVRIKAKPQPSKRFQRRHVDSLWQGDTFQFRIKGVGRVYVTGYTDDCSRYRVVSKAYLKKRKEEAINSLQWALRKGRAPKAIYLDNGKQFIAKEYKEEARKQGISLIFGRPHNPRGRGKIERYHKVLYQDLISQMQFKSLSHFRQELWKFDQKYNNWRKQEALGWQTPASTYNNPKYFNKSYKKILKKRT